MTWGVVAIKLDLAVLPQAQSDQLLPGFVGFVGTRGAVRVMRAHRANFVGLRRVHRDDSRRGVVSIVRVTAVWWLVVRVLLRVLLRGAHCGLAIVLRGLGRQVVEDLRFVR